MCIFDISAVQEINIKSLRLYLPNKTQPPHKLWQSVGSYDPPTEARGIKAFEAQCLEHAVFVYANFRERSYSDCGELQISFCFCLEICLNPLYNRTNLRWRVPWYPPFFSCLISVEGIVKSDINNQRLSIWTRQPSLLENILLGLLCLECFSAHSNARTKTIFELRVLTVTFDQSLVDVCCIREIIGACWRRKRTVLPIFVEYPINH